jgi:hypothetical protein
MLLLGHILKDDFKPDFCNYVSTNVGIRTLERKRVVCLQSSQVRPDSSKVCSQRRIALLLNIWTCFPALMS